MGGGRDMRGTEGCVGAVGQGGGKREWVGAGGDHPLPCRGQQSVAPPAPHPLRRTPCAAPARPAQATPLAWLHRTGNGAVPHRGCSGRPGPARQFRNGTTRHGTARTGPARSDTARTSPAQHGPDRTGPAWPGPGIPSKLQQAAAPPLSAPGAPLACCDKRAAGGGGGCRRAWDPDADPDSDPDSVFAPGRARDSDPVQAASNFATSGPGTDSARARLPAGPDE